MIYNVPVHKMDSFTKEAIILRSDDPAELTRATERVTPGRLVGVQVLSMDQDPSPFGRLKESIDIILVLGNPTRDSPKLYNYTDLRARHNISVYVIDSPGIEIAVRTAQALSMSVRLVLGQPDYALLDEYAKTLDFYLHNRAVRMPIEPFHTLNGAFYQNKNASLWIIQQEDPRYYSHVTNDGRVVCSGRLSSCEVEHDPLTFVESHKSRLIQQDGQCMNCKFFHYCEGYFKVPSHEFDCQGVLRLFETLWEASAKLRSDYSRYLEKSTLKNPFSAEKPSRVFGVGGFGRPCAVD